VFVCTDPEGNGHTRIARSHDGYDSGSTKPKLADMNEDDAEAARAQRRDVIESNKAWRAAEPVRREWLRGLLARKTPPKGSAALVAAVMAVAVRFGPETHGLSLEDVNESIPHTSTTPAATGS